MSTLPESYINSYISNSSILPTIHPINDERIYALIRCTDLNFQSYTIFTPILLIRHPINIKLIESIILGFNSDLINIEISNEVKIRLYDNININIKTTIRLFDHYVNIKYPTLIIGTINVNFNTIMLTTIRSKLFTNYIDENNNYKIKIIKIIFYIYFGNKND